MIYKRDFIYMAKAGETIQVPVAEVESRLVAGYVQVAPPEGEPETNEPHHDEGWLLINQYAERLDETQRLRFTSSVRNAEGAFTSGLISREAFIRLLESASLTASKG